MLVCIKTKQIKICIFSFAIFCLLLSQLQISLIYNHVNTCGVLSVRDLSLRLTVLQGSQLIRMDDRFWDINLTNYNWGKAEWDHMILFLFGEKSFSFFSLFFGLFVCIFQEYNLHMFSTPKLHGHVLSKETHTWSYFFLKQQRVLVSLLNYNLTQGKTKLLWSAVYACPYIYLQWGMYHSSETCIRATLSHFIKEYSPYLSLLLTQRKSLQLHKFVVKVNSANLGSESVAVLAKDRATLA